MADDRDRELERLREIETRWRSITENTTDTVIVADGDDRILSINRTMPPTTPEGVVGTSLYRYQFEEDHPLIRATLARVRETGQPSSYETKLHLEALGLAGPPRWFVTKVVPLTGARPGSVILIASDITERKAIERELFVAEERWRSLTINTDDTIQVIDRDGVIRFINRALPPTTVDQVIGTSIYQWVVPGDAAMIRATLERVLATGVTETYDTRIDMAAFGLPGESLWYSVKVVATTVDGEVSGAILIASNVTKVKRTEVELRRAKEQAEAASSAKSTFLANMSHEVRTPLNAIIGLTNLALKADGGPKVVDYLRKVRASSRSLLGIINDILDFSRIEAGKVAIEHEDFDLRDVLDGLGDLVGHEAHRKGIEFLVSIGPGVPSAVRGDALRLNQVLTNLAHNAVKFTHEGTIVVRARLDQPDDGARPRLRFTVTDTGVGISPEDLPRIFQSFTQLDGSITRSHGGAGLGLAICERLVGLMGGALEVDSAPGRGSTFGFTIELERQPVGRETARTVPERRRGAHVLVVDDNPLAAEILTEMLAAFGLRVAAVSSGEEALRVVRAARDSDPYALVVLDWKMPRLDGLETARRLAAEAGPARTLPRIILATAYDYPQLRALAEEAGIEEVLPKPVGESALFDAVMRALGEGAQLASPLDSVVSAVAPARALAGVRVLVVEDIDINQQIVREILEAVGATVRLASDGREALTAVYEAPFDAILMDLQMPGMDGFEAARSIRADAQFARLPIIALTAHAMRGDRERCLEAGMDDHIAKPIHAPTLIAAVRSHVRGRRSAGGDDVLTDRAAPRPEATSPGTAVPGGAAPPGLDLDDALGHYGGNVRTYRALLDGFVERYGDAAAQLRAALDGGDRTRARELVHTVVGVAGNLRLTAVYARTLEVQAALRRDSRAEIATALTALDDALREARASIATLPAAVADGGAAGSATQVGSLEELAAGLDQLDAVLARNSLDAGGVFEALRAAAPPEVATPALAAIGAAINRLDYAAARAAVAALRAALTRAPEDQPA